MRLVVPCILSDKAWYERDDAFRAVSEYKEHLMLLSTQGLKTVSDYTYSISKSIVFSSRHALSGVGLRAEHGDPSLIR